MNDPIVPDNCLTSRPLVLMLPVSCLLLPRVRYRKRNATNGQATLSDNPHRVVEHGPRHGRWLRRPWNSMCNRMLRPPSGSQTRKSVSVVQRLSGQIERQRLDTPISLSSSQAAKSGAKSSTSCFNRESKSAIAIHHYCNIHRCGKAITPQLAPAAPASCPCAAACRGRSSARRARAPRCRRVA